MLIGTLLRKKINGQPPTVVTRHYHLCAFSSLLASMERHRDFSPTNVVVITRCSGDLYSPCSVVPLGGTYADAPSLDAQLELPCACGGIYSRVVAHCPAELWSWNP